MQAPSKTPPALAAVAGARAPEPQPLGLALDWERQCLWSTRRLRCALTPAPTKPARTQP